LHGDPVLRRLRLLVRRAGAAAGEPLGLGQIAALVFTLAGVVLATRS
jgi:hypothetical protein